MVKYLQLVTCLLLFGISNQIIGQSVDFTVRYNPTAGNYEVYALPDFSSASYFVGGGSQISLVLPTTVPDAPLTITTVNGGQWFDNSQVYAPIADPVHDFHGIASNGSPITLVANEELLLYTFVLPGGGCVDGLRLFENPTDPNSTAPGMGGGDFLNYFANALTFEDNYNANYNNTGTSCNPPVVIPNPLTIPQDSTGIICSPIIDLDTGDTFTAMSCGANNGTPTVTVNGSEVCVTYIPDSGYIGSDSVCIIVCDQAGACDTTAIPVTVVPPLPPSSNPEPPLVIPTPITTPEDSTATVCTPILDPNSDDTFTATLCTGSPANGTAVPTVVGNSVCVEYTPDLGYTGSDEVCLIVCGVEDGLCDTVMIPVTVVPEIEPPTTPQPPVVVLPPLVTPEDSPITTCGPVIDPNLLDTHTAMICDQPTNGTATTSVDNATGQVCVTFIPDENFTGIDSVCVEVCDDTGLCTEVKVPIVVTPTNDPPTAIDDINLTVINEPATGSVLTNDEDEDGDSLLINTTPVGTLIGGTPTINPDGSYTFVPEPDFVGEASFQYEVCDNGSPVLCDTATVVIEIFDPSDPNNNPPLGIEDNFTTEEGSPVTASLLSNDSDPEDDLLTITTTPITDPTTGTLTINPDGTFTFIPDPDFIGQETFEYEVCDDGTPMACDTVAVTIEVLSDNGMNDTYATDDATIVNKNDAVVGDLLANDTDPEGDTQTATTTPLADPSNGTVTINPDGTYEYTPDLGYSGNDFFVYQVCDDGLPVACDSATVYLTIVEINEILAVDDINTTQIFTPTSGNVLTNDDDPEGDALTVTSTPIGTPIGGMVVLNSDGSYTFTPDSDFVGEASFQYEVCDDGSPMACDTATVTIEVIDTRNEDNNQVNGNEDHILTEEGVITTLHVLSNDTDPDGDNLIINTTLVTDPTNGTATVNLDGTITYTPDPDFVGTDSLEYQVCDDGTPVTCDTVLVTIEVLAESETNEVYATDDAASGPINTDILGSILDNDIDPEGDNLSATDVPISGPSNGSVVLLADGTYTYTPNTDYAGNDQFVYSVCDDGTPIACDTATVYLTILDLLAPPVAIPTPITILQDSTAEVCMPITDPNIGDTFTATICGAENGTPSATVNGAEVCVEYIPDPGFTGTDSVCIIVCDQTGLCDTTLIPVTVLAPLPPTTEPEPPVVITTPITVLEDSTTTVCSPILDPNIGDTFTATLCTGSPANGRATPTVVGNELCVEYTPTAGYTGEDEVCIIVCGIEDRLCDTVMIPVTVIPLPESPNSMQPPVVIVPPIVGTNDITHTVCGTIVDPNTGDTHSVTICEQPANGTATAVVDNTTGQVCITLDPDDDFVGDDSLCLIVCDDTGLCDTVTVPITIVPSVVKLELKVMLHGALFYTSDGLMRDDLKTQGLVPLSQPYNSTLSPRFTHVGGGTETTTNLVLSQSLGTPDAIVDWVFIEIRSAADSSSVIRTISALVQRDGDIIDAATGTTLCVAGLPATFFVSIKHRNHLGAMTATPMDPINEALVVDFTTMTDAEVFHLDGYDGLEMTTVTGKRALWAGNVNADEKVKYDGTSNDRIHLLNDVLLYPTNASLTLNYDNAIEYLQGDVDLSGKAKYDGMGNDRILIQNVVLTYPLNSLLLNNYNNLLEQLP